MQLMYEHLSTLAELNKRQDNFFTEAEEFKNEILKFKVMKNITIIFNSFDENWRKLLINSNVFFIG